MCNLVKCYTDIVESLYNAIWSIGIDCYNWKGGPLMWVMHLHVNHKSDYDMLDAK